MSGSSTTTNDLQWPSVNFPSNAKSITRGSKFNNLTVLVRALLLIPNVSASSCCVSPYSSNKVKLDAGRKKGKIIIEYVSNEDLERILELLDK